MFGLFDTPLAGKGPHVMEGVKGMIFILNQNPISLSFKESWLFNKYMSSKLDALGLSIYVTHLTYMLQLEGELGISFLIHLGILSFFPFLFSFLIRL